MSGKYARGIAVWVLSAVVSSLAVLAQARGGTAPKSDVIDAPQLLRDLQALSADSMQGREIGTAGGEKARAYVIERFKASGVSPFGSTYVHPFTGAGRRALSGANVVGFINGSRQPRQYIVISAHFDHIGVRNGQVFNGADDNASGTAALFAIAAYFRAHPPTNALIFAAFDGEEEGLLGSAAFVKAPPVDLASIVVNLNADMIGRDPNNVLYAVGPTRQPFLKPYIDRVAGNAPVKLVVGHDSPQLGPDDWTEDSDQFSFLQAGIPAIYLGVEDEPFHHRATDDYDSMTLPFFVKAVETTIQVAREFDQSLDAIAAQRGQRVRVN